MIPILVTAIVAALLGAGAVFLFLRRPAAQTESGVRRKSRFVAPLVLALSGVAAVAAFGVYASMSGRDDATTAAPGAHPNGEVETMVAELEAFLQANPGSASDWGMLGFSYMSLQRPQDALGAYQRAAELDPGNAGYQTAIGEARILVSGGEITPQARGAFEAALALDPSDLVARYYLAMARFQDDDAEGAVTDWIALLEDVPPGSPIAGEVRMAIQEAAARADIDLAGRLPDGPDAFSGVPMKGPSQQEMANAARMSEGDREDMIAGMLEGLELRLEDDPRDAEGWAMLIRSRVNLGQTTQAREAYDRAMAVFSDSQATRERLTQTARGLGLETN